MDIENEQAQVDVTEQEGSTQEYSDSEETVTIPKSRFTKIERKARAFDASKTSTQSEARSINNDSDADWKARMELKVEGHNDEEVNFIMKNGGKAALQDKFVLSAIDALRTQKQAETAMLGSEGNKSSATGGLSPTDFSKMSADEQLKALSNLK